MENLNIMMNETELQYIWRICNQKEILGKTWEEIALILNKNLCDDETEHLSESAYRKKYQMAKKMKEEVFDRDMENFDDRIEEYRQIKLEAEMAKKEVQTERLFVNRRIRETTRAKMIEEKVNKAIKVECDLPLPEFKPLNAGQSNSEYILSVSDLHAYKLVKIATNNYNKEELHRRMNALISDVVEVINQENISKLTIINASDNLQNALRTSDISVLEDGVIPTVVQLRRFLASWLRKLSEYVEIDYIHLISGNHSELRLLNSRTNLYARDNFEVDMAEYLYDMLSDNQRINIIIPEHDYHIFELAGYNFITHHGHKIRNARKLIEDRQRKDRLIIDYGIFGHLHHEAIKQVGESSDHDVEILQVPSVMGTDGYAEGRLNTGSKAASVMYRFTEGKGRDRAYKFILN